MKKEVRKSTDKLAFPSDRRNQNWLKLLLTACTIFVVVTFIYSIQKTMYLQQSSSVVSPPLRNMIRSTPDDLEFLQGEILYYDVIIFSKSFCPYCKNTKRLFSEKNIDAKIYELDQMSRGSEIQHALLLMTGQKTVPNVFVKGIHIGGNEDIIKGFKNGSIEDLLVPD